MPAPECGNCLWYARAYDDTGREMTVCIRFPPTVVWQGHGRRTATIWPEPRRHNLCGEHKRQETPDALR